MSTPNPSAVNQLAESKQKLASLAERRTRIQVQLETARQQLNEARAQAEAEYGTSDVARLREILAERDKANTEAAAQFQLAVTEFDAFLTRIEQAIANPALVSDLIKTEPVVAAADDEEDI